MREYRFLCRACGLHWLLFTARVLLRQRCPFCGGRALCLSCAAIDDAAGVQRPASAGRH